MINAMWKEWVLDVTHGVKELPCFCPYDREQDSVVVGMNMLTGKCPGDLIGVFHSDGQEAVEKWCLDNPDWHEIYQRDATSENWK